MSAVEHILRFLRTVAHLFHQRFVCIICSSSCVRLVDFHIHQYYALTIAPKYLHNTSKPIAMKVLERFISCYLAMLNSINPTDSIYHPKCSPGSRVLYEQPLQSQPCIPPVSAIAITHVKNLHESHSLPCRPWYPTTPGDPAMSNPDIASQRR